MSVDIWYDEQRGISGLYCNTDEVAFGPVFGEDEEPQDFLDWLTGRGFTDARRLEDLSIHADRWREEVKENENEARAERVNTDTAATTLAEVQEKAKKLK